MSNSGFTKVSALAENLRDLNVSNAKVSNLTANAVVAKQGRLVRKTFVGYSPSTFATLAATAYATLNTAPGLGAATASTALTLPQQCIIESVQMANGGTTITSGGSATFDLVTSDTLNAAHSGTAVVMLNDTTMAQVNKTVGSYNNLSVATPAGAVTATVEATTAYVNVLCNTAAVTAGNLVAYVTVLAVE